MLAISLFTNDDPTHTDALEAAVRRTLAAVGPSGCVIWATIARPPVNGVSYRAANALLRRLAASNPRLVIVPWAEQAAANPALLGGRRRASDARRLPTARPALCPGGPGVSVDGRLGCGGLSSATPAR